MCNSELDAVTDVSCVRAHGLAVLPNTEVAVDFHIARQSYEFAFLETSPPLIPSVPLWFPLVSALVSLGPPSSLASLHPLAFDAPVPLVRFLAKWDLALQFFWQAFGLLNFCLCICSGSVDLQT